MYFRSGQFVSVNESAISLLCQAFSHPINDHLSDIELKPFLKVNGEKPVLIQTSLQKQIDEISIDDSLTESEKKVHIDNLIKVLNVPTRRLYNQPEPHPNRAYFYEVNNQYFDDDFFLDYLVYDLILEYFF